MFTYGRLGRVFSSSCSSLCATDVAIQACIRLSTTKIMMSTTTQWLSIVGAVNEIGRRLWGAQKYISASWCRITDTRPTNVHDALLNRANFTCQCLENTCTRTRLHQTYIYNIYAPSNAPRQK